MKKSDRPLLPEDVKPSWLNVIRSAQAACKDNGGYAILTIRVAVKHNDAVMWDEPVLMKVSPARLADVEVDPDILGLLLAYMDQG